MKLRELLDKATPGPWSATDNDGETSFIVVGGGPTSPHDYSVCEITWWATEDEAQAVNKADGYLIAALRNAAPDLLRVVEAVASKDPLGEVHGACMTCRWCGALGSREELKHADDCEWSTARKLVGPPTSRT